MADFRDDDVSTAGIRDQLRALGRAAERSVDPVAFTPDEHVEGVTDIGVRTVPEPASRPSRGTARRSGTRPLAIAVGLILIAGAAFAFSTRSTETPEVASGGAAVVNREPDPAYDDAGWEALRQCESGGDYSLVTGNGFYGAYQFTNGTWKEVTEAAGLGRYAANGRTAADAPPEVQDTLANLFYLDRGTAPWPVCGSSVTGPMRIPLIPGWLPGPDLEAAVSLIAFVEPTASPAQIASLEATFRDRIGPEASLTFMDQAEAFAEYQQMFGDEDTFSPVTEAQMPPSFRVRNDALTDGHVDALAKLPQVLEVVRRPGDPWGESPARLRIPSLNLVVPIASTPSIEALSVGVAFYPRPQVGYLIVGHGTGAFAPFADLGLLRSGDVIEVETLDDSEMGRTSLQRLVVLDRTDATALEGPNELIGGTAPWQPPLGPGVTLTLVADAPGRPNARTIIYAKPLVYDATNFGIVSDPG